MRDAIKTTVIIPCYNEETRLDVNAFVSFLSDHPEMHIVFVNDGSSDDTVGVLNTIHKAASDNSSVVDLKQNGGKAEAVRQGMLYALQHTDSAHFGFLDADLSTSLQEFHTMSRFIKSNDFYEAVIGSRMSRMGAHIQRKFSRKVFSAVVGMMIKTITALPINDTQCGAKLFSRDMAADLFTEAFKTDWVFDVELFVRIRKAHGKAYATKRVYEYPLMRWVNPEGSKVSMKEIYRTPVMLGRIALHYNMPSLGWGGTVAPAPASLA